MIALKLGLSLLLFIPFLSFLFAPPPPTAFFFFFSFAVSLAFVKSVGCMNLVRKKRALLVVAAFSPKENLVL